MPMPIKSIDRVTLLNITLIVEAFLLFAATVWSWLANILLYPLLAVTPENLLIGSACGVGIAAASLLLMWLGKIVSFLAPLREIIITQIAPIFQELTWADALLVAAVSGFCEEVLFRGVAQAQFGLLTTSAIFGLFHCPSLKHLSYGLWAFAAGLMLGWLFTITGNLWVPIMAHAVSNAISLLFLRYGVKPVAPPP